MFSIFFNAFLFIGTSECAGIFCACNAVLCRAYGRSSKCEQAIQSHAYGRSSECEYVKTDGVSPYENCSFRHETLHYEIVLSSVFLYAYRKNRFVEKMNILGIELIGGEPAVIKNLKKGWYPFFYCKDLEEPPKSKTKISLNVPNDFYKIDSSYSPNVMVSCVLGENGAGKSTLFEVLYRIINNMSKHFKIVSHELERAEGINAVLYFEQDAKVGFIKINSLNDDDSDDEILFPGESSPKKLNSLDTENIEILEKLFYVIVANYSIYSFNPDDYLLNSGKANFYIKNMFNKNDGYITPFVILPYRDKDGVIDIKNERHLAEQRIISLAVYLHLNYGSSLVEGRIPEKIKYKFNEKSEENYRKESENKEEFDLICNIWKQFCIGKNITLSEPRIQQTAIAYLAYKTIKIQNQYGFFEKKFFESINKNDSENRTKVINRLLKDKSHITLKLRQTVHFLQYSPKLYKSLNEGFINLDEFEFAEWQRTIDDCFLMLPPPFYKSDLLFKENGTNFYSLSKMSSGEKQLFYSLSYVLYHLKNLDCDKNVTETAKKYPLYKNIQLIFDEMELYLHPEYQRKFVFRLLQMIRSCHFQNIESIHIIMATHSPFILSDIPIQNVLILKDGNIYKEEKRKQCFCANIYDILNSQFFMTSPIGEFAKQKSDDILRDSKQNKKITENQIKEYRQFIGFVDELFLKSVLKYALKKITNEVE